MGSGWPLDSRAVANFFGTFLGICPVDENKIPTYATRDLSNLATLNISSLRVLLIVMAWVPMLTATSASAGGLTVPRLPCWRGTLRAQT
jgi:uncharacterized membrane protein